jgi:hypothetical protein
METRRYFTLRIPLPSSAGWLRRLLPTPGNVMFTLLVVGGLLWAASAGALPLRAPAAAGTSTGTIAYQGRLADASGNPLTGTYNMIFRLYEAASSGAPLWTEQWTGSNGVKASDGLFNVMLGSLTPIPTSLVTDHASLFLGITVGTDDEMTPRVQLGSVPFAVQALTVPDGSITGDKLDPALLMAELISPRWYPPGTCVNLVAELQARGYARCMYVASAGSLGGQPYSVWHTTPDCSDEALDEPTLYQKNAIYFMQQQFGNHWVSINSVGNNDRMPYLICLREP